MKAGTSSSDDDVDGPTTSQDRIGARLKSLRTERGLTLEQLAELAGLTRGYLSLLERDLKRPSLAALIRIADALGTDMALLFGDETVPTPSFVVYRHSDRPVGSASTGRQTVPLAPARLGKVMEPFFISPGFEATGRVTHSGDELIVVLSGEVMVTLGEQTVTLGTNDSLYFAASVEHRLQSLGDVAAQLLVVVSRHNGAGNPRVSRPSE